MTRIESHQILEDWLDPDRHLYALEAGYDEETEDEIDRLQREVDRLKAIIEGQIAFHKAAAKDEDIADPHNKQAAFLLCAIS